MAERYYSNRDGVYRSGEQVDELLSKIEDLEDATLTVSGMMSAADKKKLDDLEDDEELGIMDLARLLED